MKFSMLLQLCGLLKPIFFSAEELFKENCAEVIIRSIYYMFIIVMCKDTFEPIGFKLVMVLNSTELYSLIPV